MLIFAVILIATIISILIFTIKNGISPMPSSSYARRVVMEEIKRLNGNSSQIIDVGSGWGTLASQAARNYPEQRVIGLENSPIPLWISRLSKWIGSCSNLMLIHHDIYTYSYTQVDIVLCYLYPGAMKRLSPIFKDQLPQDAYIISILFALPGWKPERVIECKDIYRTKVYVYRHQGECGAEKQI